MLPSRPAEYNISACRSCDNIARPGCIICRVHLEPGTLLNDRVLKKGFDVLGGLVAVRGASLRRRRHPLVRRQQGDGWETCQLDDSRNVSILPESALRSPPRGTVSK